MTGYVGIAVPARLARVSNTTLFRVAAEYLGDALHWPVIAKMNDLADPWIGPLTELKIPRSDNLPAPDGILGVWPETVVVTAPNPAPAAPAAAANLTMSDLVALLPYLPTELPDTEGVLWNNGGELAIS